jgi:uncharacterized protein (TIGR02466 family)
MENNIDVISLFPIGVLKAQFDRKFTKEEIDVISEISKDTKPNRSNFTSKDQYVLNRTEFSSIKEFLNTQLTSYYENILSADNRSKINITQSWVNFTNKNGAHHPHTHSNSYLSGVFYIKTNDNDKIHFKREFLPQLKVKPQEINFWNTEFWWLPAVEGILYIFPSYLEHWVETVTGDKTRVSLSFNSFPKGIIGLEEESNALIL